jgi:hypothetical protein
MGRTFSTYGERKGAYWVLVGKPEGRRPLRIPGVDGRIILKWIFERLEGHKTSAIWLRIGKGNGLL